jgi:hypothetical protein
MSTKAALVPSQYRDGTDDGTDDGSDHEEVPMIEKGNGPRCKRWTGNPRTAIPILALLLLASLAGNAVLLSSALLQAQDLDAISLRHTSEYCQ